MKRFANKGDIPTKQGFSEGLLEAGSQNKNLVALGADITSSVGADLFAKKYPDRFFSLGIAEQNCMGVAAGMALNGKLPVFATYGVFAAMRATDFVRISICYNELHVILGGAHAGISVGPDGATHQALEDIAVMRVLPNMTVLSPCDANQTRKAMIAATDQVHGPVYLRFGRAPVPNFTDDELDFTIGKAQVLHSGDDLSIVSTGHMVWEALQAAYKLSDEGIHARVINMHTIKPLDHLVLLRAAKETRGIITAEEHQINGGLGGAVAEFLSASSPARIEFIGMPDSFGESGDPQELMQKYGMKAQHIIDKAHKLLNI